MTVEAKFIVSCDPDVPDSRTYLICHSFCMRIRFVVKKSIVMIASVLLHKSGLVLPQFINQYLSKLLELSDLTMTGRVVTEVAEVARLTNLEPSRVASTVLYDIGRFGIYCQRSLVIAFTDLQFSNTPVLFSLWFSKPATDVLPQRMSVLLRKSIMGPLNPEPEYFYSIAKHLLPASVLSFPAESRVIY